MVRRHTRQIAVGLALAFLFWFTTIQLAYADNERNRPPDNRPPDRGDSIHVDNSTRTHVGIEAQGGDGGAGGEATATVGDVSSAGGEANAAATVGDTTALGGEGIGTASASNDGVTVEGDRVENNSSNVVLVPNNNTSDCNRVYGISFGNGEGAGALGVPFRDKACDFEQAADDAAASGQQKIAWWWRCHKPNLYKTFKQKDDSKAMAQLKCWNSMVEMLDLQSHNSDDDASYLMAQVSEEQLEMVEERINQQQNLIQSLEKDHADKDAEIERLKRQAAKLRAEQKQQEDADAARRAAALKALSKKSEDK